MAWHHHECVLKYSLLIVWNAPKKSILDSDNGLTQDSRQSIISYNDNIFYWRILLNMFKIGFETFQRKWMNDILKLNNYVEYSIYAWHHTLPSPVDDIACFCTTLFGYGV